MNTRLYVGNLPFTVDETYVETLFSQTGEVKSVAMPIDRETGRKRGFAFVEMENSKQAEAAIEQFNGNTVEGRQIVVNPSRPRTGNW
ncbi:MAG: RNA-binding protein [Candidatus Obscuribacterales bacterium]|nr:RNA-binding protein [Candidatus Obscuribacterales bacterium]